MMDSSTAPTGTPRVLSLALLACFVAAGTLWALGVPIGSAPDEPNHILKAVAVSDGQWAGPLGEDSTNWMIPGALTTVTVPEGYAAIQTAPACFIFNPAQDASCQPDLFAIERGADVEALTSAGQYPPLYYFLVGWPSRFLQPAVGVYAMRLVSIVVCSLLVGLGLWSLTSLRNSAVPVGVAIGVTPTALFLSASVNPNGFEFAAAFALWCGLLAIFRAPGGIRAIQPYVGAAVGLAALLNTRPVSPLWALLVVITCLLLIRPDRFRELLLQRAFWIVVAVGAISSITAVVWTLTHGELMSADLGLDQYADKWLALTDIFRNYPWYLQTMIGMFGWLDAPIAAPLATAWTGAFIALALVAIPLRQPTRATMVALGACVILVFVPLAVQFPSIEQAGMTWQGRYALAYAVGVPLLFAIAIDDAEPRNRTALVTIGPGIALLVAGAHTGAFIGAVIRYSTGNLGFPIPTRWSGPIGLVPSSIIFAAVAYAAAVVLIRMIRTTSGFEHLEETARDNTDDSSSGGTARERDHGDSRGEGTVAGRVG